MDFVNAPMALFPASWHGFKRLRARAGQLSNRSRLSTKPSAPGQFAFSKRNACAFKLFCRGDFSIGRSSRVP